MWASGVKPGAGLTSASLYVKRAGVVAYDKIMSDFTFDNTWRDMDLSAIVPANAQLIHCVLMLYPVLDNFTLLWRSKDDSSDFPIIGTYATYMNKQVRHEFDLPCDANRIVQYQGSVSAGLTGGFVILGWTKTAV